MLYTIGTSVEAIRKIAVGWSFTRKALTEPKKAFGEVGAKADPARVSDVEALSAEQQREFQEIKAQLAALREQSQPPA